MEKHTGISNQRVCRWCKRRGQADIGKRSVLDPHGPSPDYISVIAAQGTEICGYALETMDEGWFRTLTRRAQLTGDRDYAMGYLRGWRRHHHGENVDSPGEHARWMSFGLDGDPRVDLGRGYRDGVAGREPAPLILSDGS
jgi:hypothetical protein